MLEVSGKLVVYWQDIEEAINGLSRLLKPIKAKGIIAIARGGMVPAVMLAHKLAIQRVLSISVKSYEGQTKMAESAIFDALPSHVLQSKQSGWIIIDDICDSGQSLSLVKGMLPKAFTACLFCKPTARVLPDFWYFEAESDKWIVFPWERKNA